MELQKRPSISYLRQPGFFKNCRAMEEGGEEEEEEEEVHCLGRVTTLVVH